MKSEIKSNRIERKERYHDSNYTRRSVEKCLKHRALRQIALAYKIVKECADRTENAVNWRLLLAVVHEVEDYIFLYDLLGYFARIGADVLLVEYVAKLAEFLLGQTESVRTYVADFSVA